MRMLFALFMVVLVVALIVAGFYSRVPAERGSEKLPERVISLSPSVTESLYFLGQWDKVIAVSRYCAYPPEVNEKPRVSGILDINYEAVVAMKPDLVILSDMQEEGAERLESMGIKTLVVYQNTIEGVLQSLIDIGAVMGAEDRATELVKELGNRVAAIEEAVAPYGGRSVIFAVSRDVGSGTVNNLIIAGNDGYYSKITGLLNAVNPFGKYAAYATVSREGLYWVNPDVVIELVYSPGLADASLAEWATLPKINAVREGRVCMISGSFGYVPGPRFPLLIEAAAECIYPEAFQ